MTAANSVWEYVDGRVWDGSTTAMCVSAGSRMFWSVLINNSLGRHETGAGTEEKHWSGGGVKGRREGMCSVLTGGSSQNEEQQGGGCCFLS